MQIKPTIWQRVNMAARLMRGEPFRNLPSQAKQAPGSIFIWPDFRQGSPVWASGNFEDYALEGFQRNSLIYSAIMFKVRAQMAAPLRAYEGDVDAPTPLKAAHPLAQLLARPNLYMSWPEFQGINTVYLNLAGETFIALLRPRMGGMVERMLPLRPDRCFPIPDAKGGLKGYFYCPENVNPANGIPMALEDVIHIKLPNPLDPLEGLGRGLSPLASLAYSASVDNMITEFLYGFFKTGAMPTGILRFNVPLQAEEADRIKERWHELHGGYEKWSDVAVLDNAGEYQRVGLTFEEMGFLGIDERNESRILGPFGVPPILIGSRVGLMRCLPGDARVMTLNGPKAICAIGAGEFVWSFVDGRLQPRLVTESAATGVKRIYEIRTKNRILRASGNHPVLVRVPGRKDGCGNAERHAAYAWKRVDELTLSDKVVQFKYLPDQEGADLPDGGAATPEFVQFCGAMIGDGSITRGTIRMAMPPNDRSATFYRDVAPTLFTKQPYASRPAAPVEVHQRARDFGFCTKLGAVRLATLGFGGNALTKRVPGWVFGLARDLRLAFLAGVVDTDGSIDKRGVLSVSFANYDLVLDVRDLLLSVGIQCSNVYYHAYSPDVLPQQGSQAVYHSYAITASSAAQVAQIPFTDPLYRERVEANAGRIKADGKDAAQAGLSDELGFYAIRSISVCDEPEMTYDLTVEDGHSFIADGLVVHNSTYANYEQARKAFWEDTFKPELGMYELEYKYYLQGEGGEFVAFDYSDVPALQKDVIPAVAAWAQMVDRGVPKNIAAGVLKIPLPALPDDDVGYMNPMLQSVGGKAPLPNTSTTPALPAPKPETEETEEGAAEAEEQSEDEGAKAMKRPFEMKSLAPEAKADHWKRFDATARRHEEAMRRVAVKRFREDEKEYLAAITGTRRKSIEDKATIDWEYLTSQWDKATFESEKLWEADLIPVLKGVITDAGEQLGQTVGLSFTLPDIRGAAWFNRYVLKFAKNDATQITNATKDQLSALLQQAKIEGWSMRELEKQLSATFDRFLGEEANLSEEERAWFAERAVPYRIENIARTETIRASNGGNFDLMRAWGAPQHEWLATMDDRVRESHADVDGHIVDVGDYFYVDGEKMLYPGDPSASAGNVVNCRCTTVPVGIEDMDKPRPFDPDSESIGQ